MTISGPSAMFAVVSTSQPSASAADVTNTTASHRAVSRASSQANACASDSSR